jgi:hypothetical protein
MKGFALSDPRHVSLSSHIPGMSKPLVVTIPHRLGQAEAVTRLKSGLDAAQAKFGQFFSVQEQTWTGNRLQFRLSALAQSVSGKIDVFDDHVRLELVLPWLLATIAQTVQPLIRKEGTLLLEKK